MIKEVTQGQSDVLPSTRIYHVWEYRYVEVVDFRGSKHILLHQLSLDDHHGEGHEIRIDVNFVKVLGRTK